VLAIGLVVDDAIIVVEAVKHHMNGGLSPRDAAHKAMNEVGGAVVAIALILAAVFIPTAAVPGITGRLYQQFAITIAVSVLISAFNALTLSPALAALLLKPKERSTVVARWFGFSHGSYLRRLAQVFRGATAHSGLHGHKGACHIRGNLLQTNEARLHNRSS
jgi:multidrug efflux pump subunit AcrB